jgi:hypothetical protein
VDLFGAHGLRHLVSLSEKSNHHYWLTTLDLDCHESVFSSHRLRYVSA